MPLLDQWLEEELDHMPLANTAPFPDHTFRLRRRHVRSAIRHTNNSSPGPDGIPFVAWRRLEGLAVDVLFEAFQSMTAEAGPEVTLEEYQELNSSLLFFLPKSPTGTQSDGAEYYAAKAVRPLNVTNSDNRILASAVRILIEPWVGPRVSDAQRGFIAGRSMLANIVDIDEAMAVDALSTEGDSATVFFDFAAAFPYVKHEFLHRFPRRSGGRSGCSGSCASSTRPTRATW